jgi:hypothetical protein
MLNFAEQSETIAQEEVPYAPPRDNLERRVFRTTAIVLATLAAAYVIWLLVDLLLLLFACTLVSLILLTFTNAMRRRTNLPFGVSLGLVVIGLLALIGGAVAFFGATMQSQFSQRRGRTSRCGCAPQGWAPYCSIARRVRHPAVRRWLTP